MNYASFASEITAKFGIVCEGWPLEKFCPPSMITLRVQLDTLCQAWETEVASFRKLSKGEYEKWSSARFQSALQQSLPQEPQITQTSTSVIAHEANILSHTTPPAITASPSESTAAPEAIVLPLILPPPTDIPASMPIMSVSGTVLVAKKTRKQRSDKGKPRGPHVWKNAAPVTTAE